MASTPSTPPRMIRPRPLVAGDLVAIVAPSSRYDAAALGRGAAVLESWGLRVELPGPSTPRRYLAAPDAERAEALTRAFVRDDVAAVIAVRGGFGAARLHGLFDARVAAQHPKFFVGYSDLTVLLSRLQSEAGLVCFHGPMVSSDLARLPEANLERFRRLLFGQQGWWTEGGLATRVAGVAEGRLAGGCLSILASTLGTPYEVDTEGSVLFLEDIAEKPYRIDRLLTQMLHAGKFSGVRGVVLGTFHDCDEADAPGRVLEVFDELLAPLGIPVVSGFDAGHYSGGGILPLGCRVRLDAGAETLHLLEPALAGGPEA